MECIRAKKMQIAKTRVAQPQQRCSLRVASSFEMEKDDFIAYIFVLFWKFVLVL